VAYALSDEMKIMDLGWSWRSLTTSTIGYSSDSWASFFFDFSQFLDFCMFYVINVLLFQFPTFHFHFKLFSSFCYARLNWPTACSVSFRAKIHIVLYCIVELVESNGAWDVLGIRWRRPAPTLFRSASKWMRMRSVGIRPLGSARSPAMVISYLTAYIAAFNSLVGNQRTHRAVHEYANRTIFQSPDNVRSTATVTSYCSH